MPWPTGFIYSRPPCAQATNPHWKFILMKSHYCLLPLESREATFHFFQIPNKPQSTFFLLITHYYFQSLPTFVLDFWTSSLEFFFVITLILSTSVWHSVSRFLLLLSHHPQNERGGPFLFLITPPCGPNHQPLCDPRRRALFHPSWTRYRQSSMLWSTDTHTHTVC